MAADTDEWGQPGSPDWQQHLGNVPCRAVQEAGREPVDSNRTVVVLDMRILLPLGTDVTERDRVASVTERGSQLFEGPLAIEAVLTRRTHLELVLQRIR